jgi:hypothetical protein
MEDYIAEQNFIIVFKQLLLCKNMFLNAIFAFINRDEHDSEYAIAISRLGPKYYDLMAQAKSLFKLLPKSINYNDLHDKLIACELPASVPRNLISVEQCMTDIF